MEKNIAVPELEPRAKDAIDAYLAAKLKLDPRLREAIDAYLTARLKRAAAAAASVIAGIAALGWFTFVPELIKNQVNTLLTTDQIIQARTAALQNAMDSIARSSEVTGRSTQLQARLESLEKDVSTLENGSAAGIVRQLGEARSLVKSLSSIGGIDTGAILKRLDDLEGRIPTRIEVTRGQQLPWGNRNSHQYLCSDQQQVMIAGAIGTTNADFSAYCGQLVLR